MLLVHRRDIIEPVKIGQVLQIGAAFHQLFRATMQQADMRVTALYDLSIQLKHQPQHAVRGGVLWPEIDVEVADALFACQRVVEAFGAVHHAVLQTFV